MEDSYGYTDYPDYYEDSGMGPIPLRYQVTAETKQMIQMELSKILKENLQKIIKENFPPFCHHFLITAGAILVILVLVMILLIVSCNIHR
jgi:hypothetical protein